MNKKYNAFNSPTFLAYALIAPAAIYILAIVAWPLIETIRLSFTNSSLAGEEYIGFENYETELKDTSVTLKTTLYDVTYGATGAKEETGWFWKYIGIGYGFGTDVVECSFCETNFYDGFAMQYILLFNIPISQSFNLKALSLIHI